MHELNWRKPVIHLLSWIQGSKRFRYCREIISEEKMSEKDRRIIQEKKLKKILLYAYKNVPYYREILKRTKVLKGNDVYLENFSEIPVLTKDILRAQFKRLQSKETLKKMEKEMSKRKLFLQKVIDFVWVCKYENTSGGSTGEPVRFIQDKEYEDWNIAYKFYIRSLVDQNIGESELRLWGSEKDIFDGKDTFEKQITNFFFNRVDLNSFKMTEEGMFSFVRKWNRHKPMWIEAYVQSAYEFARFLEKENLNVFVPKGILTSAGILNNITKKRIEETFKCSVINRYGSREVGDIAVNVPGDSELYVNTANIFLEILDEDGSPITKSGKSGNVCVTLLTNYSMPLIRYSIGDIAEWSKESTRTRPKLKRILGRSVSFIKMKNGGKIDGEYFTHLFYFKSWIKKFQIIQKSYTKLLIKVVLDGKERVKEKDEIEDGIKKVLGDEISIEWKYCKDIKPLKNGKYSYVYSEI